MNYDVLDKGFVRYVDHMGTDLTVVNAARVSFAKKSDWGYIIDDVEGGDPVFHLQEKDVKLIGYLARHKHWTPFGHCCATVHLKMPVFVARQWMRSNVGIVYNEISRRYVDSEPEFYEPKKWRARPDGSVKQGSGEVLDEDISWALCIDRWGYADASLLVYQKMLDAGVAPEMARMVLPLSMYTEIWMTASLAALARVCSLRTNPHAQLETQLYAIALSYLCRELWPVSWDSITENPPC